MKCPLRKQYLWLKLLFFAYLVCFFLTIYQYHSLCENCNDTIEPSVDDLTANLTYEDVFNSSLDEYNYNAYLSNFLSYHRKIANKVVPECLQLIKFYKRRTTTVIVTFYKEAVSVLLRTVHLILDNSPLELLEEIILVDDCSEPKYGMYLRQYWVNNSLVKVVRTRKREGTTGARLYGARMAKSKILTFLDAHCEPQPGWLEPLLDRLNYLNNVACSFLDEIDPNTFRYSYDVSSFYFIAAFNWDLKVGMHLLHYEAKSAKMTQRYSFALPGGVFTIYKDFFLRLYKSYEEDSFGVHNLELSFKIWMCGGSLEVVPCSHVGHVLGKGYSYQWLSHISNDMVARRNLDRLADVWLEEYSIYYYQTRGIQKTYVPVENRKQPSCKNFSWFIKNVYRDLYDPTDSFAYGRIRNIGFLGKYCLDVAPNLAVVVTPCNMRATTQFFIYTRNGEIRRTNLCLDFTDIHQISMRYCHNLGTTQHWRYDTDTQVFEHGIYEVCLAINGTRLEMQLCDGGSPQMWFLENYNTSRGNKET